MSNFCFLERLDLALKRLSVLACFNSTFLFTERVDLAEERLSVSAYFNSSFLLEGRLDRLFKRLSVFDFFVFIVNFGTIVVIIYAAVNKLGQNV